VLLLPLPCSYRVPLFIMLLLLMATAVHIRTSHQKLSACTSSATAPNCQCHPRS
jgi:hypothetical protein